MKQYFQNLDKETIKNFAGYLEFLNETYHISPLHTFWILTMKSGTRMWAMLTHLPNNQSHKYSNYIFKGVSPDGYKSVPIIELDNFVIKIEFFGILEDCLLKLQNDYLMN